MERFESMIENQLRNLEWKELKRFFKFLINKDILYFMLLIIVFLFTIKLHNQMILSHKDVISQ